MKLIMFVLLLVFTSCQQIGEKKAQANFTREDTLTFISSDLGETKGNRHLVCPKADSISLIFNTFIKEKNLYNIDSHLFYQLLRQNDLDESVCHFPRNNQEIELFNRFTIELLKGTQTNKKAILLLIYIFDTSRRSVELIEFLQSKLADIFVYDTDNYLNVIESLDNEKQNRAIAVIEFINNKEDLLKLKAQIGQHKFGDNVEFIEDIEEKINEEIRR